MNIIEFIIRKENITGQTYTNCTMIVHLFKSSRPGKLCIQIRRRSFVTRGHQYVFAAQWLDGGVLCAWWIWHIIHLISILLRIYFVCIFLFCSLFFLLGSASNIHTIGEETGQWSGNKGLQRCGWLNHANGCVIDRMMIDNDNNQNPSACHSVHNRCAVADREK